ncbi:MAG: hypothetical protein ACFFG0_41155 [Candidatus Thorarchaeota archaeon]
MVNKMCDYCESGLPHEYIIYTKFDSYFYACEKCFDSAIDDNKIIVNYETKEYYILNILMNWSIKELKNYCRVNDIKGFSNKRKDNLVCFVYRNMKKEDKIKIFEN